MKIFLRAVALCAVSALAVPGIHWETRDLAISKDGACGSGVSCKGSKWGDCCSDIGSWFVASN